jgi:hypothetical protein
VFFQGFLHSVDYFVQSRVWFLYQFGEPFLRQELAVVVFGFDYAVGVEQQDFAGV